MRVLLLKGHTRPITQIVYNEEGDLLFTASKGDMVNAWRSDNGERLGSYQGHTGAIYSLCVNKKTTRLITAGADYKVKVWDAETGKELHSIHTSTPGRAVAFFQGEKFFAVAIDNVLGYTAAIQIFPFSEDTKVLTDKPIREVQISPKVKILDLFLGNLNTYLFAATDNGKVLVFDPISLEIVHEICEHKPGSKITRLTPSKDMLSFMTASADHTSKLFDARTFECIKSYETGRPCNASDFQPKMNHVLLAGGQPPSEVTGTRVDPTQFATRIYHKIFEDELGIIAGHFGTVNDIRVCPNGSSFATGGEDGYVRMNFFEESYFKELSDEVYYKKTNEKVSIR